MSGTKRSSPGATESKDPFGEIELGEEEAKKLDAINKKSARIDLMLRERT